MPRRRVDVAPWAVIAACVAWTGQYLWFGKELADMAATRWLIWQGDVWRIPSAIFSHGGLTHLVVNCLGILFIGPFVARAFGGLVFVLMLLFSAFAGLAASLLTHPPYVQLVGISGGVVGLLGVILGVEWRLASGFAAFLRQRNTRVVIIVIVVNALLAVFIESRHGKALLGQPVRLDHAAHIGGFVFGLLGTLALLRKRDASGIISRNSRRALVAALVLAIAPLVYASWPQWTKADITALRKYAERALARGDRGRAARLHRQILSIDPKNPISGAWIALHEDDPCLLYGLGEPLGDAERRAVLLTHLHFAYLRLQDRPAEALALVQRIEIRKPFGAAWLSFAQAAQQAGATAAAAHAFNEAALSLKRSEAWQAFASALPVQVARVRQADVAPEERLIRAMEAADIANNAIGGIKALENEPGREGFETSLRDFAATLFGVANSFGLLEHPPEGWRELYSVLAGVYRKLADLWTDGPNEPDNLYRSARAWWLQIKSTDAASEQLQYVAARYGQALKLARNRGEKALEQQIRAWFAKRGLPVPNLADEEGGD